MVAVDDFVAVDVFVLMALSACNIGQSDYDGDVDSTS